MGLHTHELKEREKWELDPLELLDEVYGTISLSIAKYQRSKGDDHVGLPANENKVLITRPLQEVASISCEVSHEFHFILNYKRCPWITITSSTWLSIGGASIPDDSKRMYKPLLLWDWFPKDSKRPRFTLEILSFIRMLVSFLLIEECSSPDAVLLI